MFDPERAAIDRIIRETAAAFERQHSAHDRRILDLFAEDSWRRVYGVNSKCAQH